MTRNEHEIRIARPPADVFPYVEDPAKAAQWLSGLMWSSQRPTTPDFRQVVDVGGRVLRMEGEVTACDPPRLIAFVLRSSIGDMAITYRLTEADGHTTLHYTCETALSGLRRLAAPVFWFLLQRKIVRDLRTLRTLLEGG